MFDILTTKEGGLIFDAKGKKWSCHIIVYAEMRKQRYFGEMAGSFNSVGEKGFPVLFNRFFCALMYENGLIKDKIVFENDGDVRKYQIFKDLWNKGNLTSF